jgi:hypothetical protein
MLTGGTEILEVIPVSMSLYPPEIPHDCPGNLPDLRDEGAVYNRLSHDILTESVCYVAKFKTRWIYKLLITAAGLKVIHPMGLYGAPDFGESQKV